MDLDDSDGVFFTVIIEDDVEFDLAGLLLYEAPLGVEFDISGCGFMRLSIARYQVDAAYAPVR